MTDIRTVARQLIEEDLNTGDPGAAERIIAPDFVDHTNPPHLQHGLAGHRGIVDLFHAAFPDVKWTIDDMVADGDRVALRLTMTGTHRGDFFGVPATGRRVVVGGTHILRIRDGRVAEHWGNNDDLGLMRELGAMPDSSKLPRPAELLQRFGQAIAGEGTHLQSMCAPDVEFTDSMSHTRGIPELEGYLRSWWTAFPDARVSIDNVVHAGDQAVGEMRYSGTHRGPMAGPQGEIAPTGRSVELRGAAWITVRADQITRFNGYYDTATIMEQLGLMPTPAAR